jgi:hypothetical protein
MPRGGRGSVKLPKRFAAAGLRVCGSEISVTREHAGRGSGGDAHRVNGRLLVGGAKNLLGRERVRYGRLLILFGLAAALAMLSSCGSSSTAVAPTITASCVPTVGTGADVTVNGTAQCTASVVNASSTLVNWSVSGTGTGSIGETSGLYTAPTTVPSNNVVTITATSQVDSSLTATTTLTIVAATAIAAIICDDPSGNQASTVSSMSELTCTAFSSVSTGTTVAVNWSVANTKNASDTVNLGSISSLGVYTAPLVPPAGQTVTITATSKSLSSETTSVQVTVVFGNSVLSGTYVFSTQGRLTSNGAFWARTGSLTVGGGSLIGIEDTNQGGSPNTVNASSASPPSPRAFTGSYSIGSDGRGTMQFCEDTTSACGSATSFFRIAVISPKQIEIIEDSPSIAAGGEMLSQDSSILQFANKNQILSGVYSFNFSGVSTTAAEESVVGEFAANGFQTISAGSTAAPVAPGELDINAGGATVLAGTTYTISSNLRGTVALNGLNFNLKFSFYPVSASHSKFIEIDQGTLTTPASIVSGDAYLQQTQGLTCGWGLDALMNGSGSTVLETTGLETNSSASGVVIQDVGNFTASNGAVAAGWSVDQNDGGTYTPPAATASGTYTMDPCGRGTLSLGAHSYVFYIISPSDAVLQEVTSGVVAHGLLVPSQGGPFTDATLTGSYAFRLGGTDAAGAAGHREDFVGQLSSSGSGTGLAGTMDLNDFGATQANLAIANGTYATPSALRTTMALPVATSPATTRNLVLYMVSPTLFYVLDADTTGTAVGLIGDQF